MIETDPLSLVFIACFVFASAFILATTLLGATHTHGLHIGGAEHVDIGGHGGDIDLSSDADIDLSSHGAPAFIGNILHGINLNAILGFLFGFGLLGYLLHNSAHTNAIFTIFLAIIFGVGGATALNAIMIRLFGAESGRLGADSSAMEGRIATVSIPIRPGGVGEVIFLGENGTRRSLGARSTDGSAIERDADVVILGYKNGIAEVQPWERFIAAHADRTDPAPPGQTAH